MLANALEMCMVPVVAAYSDRFGRRPFMALGILLAAFAPEAAFTDELFPKKIRVSGSSLSKQMGIILGGGIAPLVGTALMGGAASFTPVILYFEAMLRSDWHFVRT